MQHLRFERRAAHDASRWTIGVLVSSRCQYVRAALVATTGDGLDAQATIIADARIPVPGEAAALYRRLAAPAHSSSEPAGLGQIALLRSELAGLEAALVAELVAKPGIPPPCVLAVGVHDPGLWNLDRAPHGYLGLCDAAMLAERTGLNVIDAFPGRDLAQGGQGGPIGALAEWLLLGQRGRGRALLDLGQTVRMTYLPDGPQGEAARRILSFDVGPGMRLLDMLADRLTGGKDRYDAGGRLAVQGRRILTLLEHWLANPYFDRPLPRWHPRGVQPERFLADALTMAVHAGWSVRDLLCTATHFIAESVALAVRRWLPQDGRLIEILLSGGGQHNGMLLREIAARLPDVPLVPVGDLGIPDDAIPAANIALLAIMYLDQTPANPSSVTGAEVPRVLGRLTPGSPQSWQRLLYHLAGSSPSVRPLRSAI